MKKLYIGLVCILLLLTACGKKEASPPVPEEKETQQKDSIESKEEKELEEEKEDLSGKAVNPLTGLYIEEESAQRRPIAVMINNLHKALPQSGIGQADLIYEALAEGEITRLVAVFQNFDAEKIGPVRSAREYFTYFALDNNAVYVHHGGSETGYSAIRKRGLNAIDGMTDKTAFWRDKARANKPGMYEHSSYVSAEGLLESCANRGFSMENDKQGMFLFFKEDTDLKNDNLAQTITIPYSYYQRSQFQYNSEKKQYERWQSDAPQIDELTGETIAVKNVIVQYADTAVIDNEGRRKISLVGSGEGFYFTNGKADTLTWSKESYDSPTKWFDSSGKPLQLNCGKTFICICPIDLPVRYE